jgi:hypothetical protein
MSPYRRDRAGIKFARAFSTVRVKLGDCTSHSNPTSDRAVSIATVLFSSTENAASPKNATSMHQRSLFNQPATVHAAGRLPFLSDGPKFAQQTSHHLT